MKRATANGFQTCPAEGWLFVDEDHGVAAVVSPPQLCAVGLGPWRIAGWMPVFDVVEPRLDFQPDTTCVRWADPAFDSAPALDAHCGDLLKRQEPLHLNPSKPIFENELRTVSIKELCTTAAAPVPSRPASFVHRTHHPRPITQGRPIVPQQGG